MQLQNKHPKQPKLQFPPSSFYSPSALKLKLQLNWLTNMNKLFRFVTSIVGLCIILGGWFLGSLILIQVDSEELLRRHRFEVRNRETLEHVDNYCRTLDKQKLAKESHIGPKVWKLLDKHKDDALEKWENARREKLIRENLVYFPKLGQMWCLVPKSASTSWSRAIIDRINENSSAAQRLEFNSTYPLQLVLKNHYGNINRTAFAEAVRSPKVKKILLVRHPFSRISSAYQDKLADRKARSDGMHFFQNFGVRINRGFRQDRKLNKQKEPTFEEFLEYLINTKAIDYDEHWKPIALLCGLCHVKYDQIIFTEDLKEVSDLMLDKLEFPKSIKLYKENNLAARISSSEQFANISSSKKVKLLGKFQDDFRLFQYSFLKHYI